LGVFDFSYQHYALGDLLTNHVNLAIMAIEQGLRQIDIMVMVNPNRPSARQQTFITRANYVAHLDNIMPAFACSPLLRSLQLIRDVRARGVTVMMVEHVMEVLLPLVDRAVVLDLGRVLTIGAPQDVVRNPDVIRAYLGGGGRQAAA
jgi:ABC-type sugar transport system ATPase subunit